MLKTKLAGVLTAVVCVGAGAASASPSAFPSSVDDSSGFSIPYQGMPSIAQGVTGTVFPSSADDFMTFWTFVPERSMKADALTRSYGSVLPSPVNESGSM